MIIRDWCLLIALCVMLGSIVAHAAPITGTATITMPVPTTKANGDPLPAAEFKHFTLMWGLKPGVYTESKVLLATDIPYKWTFPVDVPIGGSTPVYYAATATDTKGRISGVSAEQTKRFYAEATSPPAMPVFTSVNGGGCVPDGTGYSCSTVKP